MSTQHTSENHRDGWPGRWIREASRDVRHAARVWARAPGFTLTSAVVLAVGIGASTVVFSIIDAVLLRPLPYQDPGRLVAVWNRNIRQQGPSKLFDAYADFEEYSRHAASFASVAAATWAVDAQALSGRGPTREVLAIPVSASFFSTLGVPALLGRSFVAGDESGGCAVVLSHTAWQNTLQGDKDIVGAAISLDHRSCTVVGVMGPEFAFYPQAAQLWTLLGPDFRPARAQMSVGIIARLKPGVTPPQAQSELTALYRALHPKEGIEQDLSPTVATLQGEFTWLASRTLRSTLFALSGAVLFVLLIACLNVANLLLGQSLARDREFAVRAALGASRDRLVRQLVTEGLVLSLFGGSLGVALAFAAIRYFHVANPIELPVGADIGLHVPTLVFTAGVSMLTTLVFALMPALRASRTDVQQGLKSGGHAAISGRSGRRLVTSLVAIETALSVTLLVGAGLLTQSVLRMSTEPLGFDPENLVTLNLSLPDREYPDATRQLQLYEALERRLAAIPGVTGIALGSPRARTDSVEIEGESSTAHRLVARQTMTPASMSVFRVPLRRGRTFTDRDGPDAEPVAVVNDAFVRDSLAGSDPIGRRIRLGEAGKQGPWMRIVGVAGNVKGQSLYQEMSWTESPVVFRPVRQEVSRRISVAIRTTPEVAGLGDAVQTVITALAPTTGIGELRTMNAQLARGLAYPRFRAFLSSGFAASALLLAVVGLYGVVGQFVAQRKREFAVRMAIGASKRHIVMLVARHGGVPVVVGLAAGLACSFVLARALGSLLYGVGPADLLTLAVMSATLLLAAVIAMALPARRAAHVDPMVALRDE
jgi:putative ABC transport system permease protein